jgi:hypothetical protein
LDGLQYKKHRLGGGEMNEMKNKNRFPEEEMDGKRFFYVWVCSFCMKWMDEKGFG